MKKDTLTQKLFCLLVVLFGSLICGLGIQMTLMAGIGVDPITLFEEGASKVSSLPVGTVAILFNLFNLTLGFFLYRKAINWGSLVATFSVGSGINLWAAVLPAAPDSLFVRLPLDIIGVLVIGLGIAIYMLPEYGAGGLEAMMLFLSERFKKPMGPMRVAIDCSWGLIGILLGGTLGLGTIIGGVGIGMSIQLFYKPLKKLLDNRNSK